MVFVFLGFCSSQVFGQILTPTYPNPAENLTRGIGQSKLTIQVLFSNACVNDTIKVEFPTSVSYIPGSINKIQGSQTISEADISDLNKPSFKISDIPAGGGSIEFELLREAACGTLSSGKDKVFVLGSCGSAKETAKGINTYTILGASLSLLPPPAISGAVIGSKYNREIKITNGGNGDLDTLYYVVFHENVANVSAQNIIIANGINFQPYKIGGDSLYYKIAGPNLFSGDSLMSNGETVLIKEYVEVKACGAKSKYLSYWNDKTSQICQKSFGTASISMIGGVPALTKVTRTEINYIDKCTPYDIKFTAINGGTGNDTAAGMYDVRIEHGYVYPRRTYVQAYNSSIVEYSNGRINGNIVSSFATTGSIVNMDLKDLFTTDPDGPGQGLEDLDGDGYFDDLPRGNNLSYTLNLKWKCNTKCGVDKILYTGARLHFTTMCGDLTASEPKYSYRPIYESRFTGTSYVPSNIMGGVPFRIKLREGHYINSYSKDNVNTRYEWRLILPPNISVSGSGNPTYGTGGATYTQNGDTLIITSSNNKLANAEIDLVLNCGTGGDLNFRYELHKIDNNITNCRCQSLMVCSSVYAASFCPGPCNGVSNFIPKVERTDGSLGWTDKTMTTRQSRSAISSFDLSKALFLDTIQVKGSARQNDTSSNFHLEMETPRAGSVNKLEPIDGDIEVLRAGIVIAKVTTSQFTQSIVSGNQNTHWDFTNVLPAGGLLKGDSIVTTTRYVVATNAGLPENDIQSGGRFYHYNLANGVKKYCFDPLAEMYLVGTRAVDGRNGFYASGCNISSLGGSGSNLARRFNTSGDMYETEFRPVFYIDSVVMLMPEGYRFISMTNNIGGGTMSPNAINGLEYKFINPGTWDPLGLTVTNSYGASFRYSIQPTCKTEPTAIHGIKFYIKDYYYANATKSVYPSDYQYIFNNGTSNVSNQTDFKKQTVYYNTANTPLLVSQNLTGDIQGSKVQHHWDVEVRNDGLSAAPYHWIALEKLNGSGIQIDSVVNLSNNQKLDENPYGLGSIWCPVSMGGIASGTNSTVRVFFKYTKCDADSILFRTGWNCAGYPDSAFSDNSSYCSKSEQFLKVIPNESQLQLAMLLPPGNGGPINLCNKDSVSFVINSAQAADLINPKVEIYSPIGIDVTPIVKVEYPSGSGNIELITTTNIPGGLALDLSAHSAIGSKGLPGTINNQGVAGRQASVLLIYKASCDHVSGASISFVGYGNGICGGLAKGNGTVLQSGRIDINGASVSGAIGLDATVSADTFSCANRKQTMSLSATPVLDSSQVGDTVTYTLPIGLSYAGNFTTSTNCNNCDIIVSDGVVPGTKLVKVALEVGVPPSQSMLYSFDVEMTGILTCGTKQIEVAAQRVIPPLMCDTNLCRNSSVLVGVFNKDIISTKPTISFESYEVVKMTYQMPYKYVYKGRVKNESSNISAPNMRMHTFIDNNQNSIYDAADSLVQIVTIPTAINAGSHYDFTDSFTSMKYEPSSAYPLYSVIDTSYSPNNCMCNPDAVSIFLNALPLELLAFNGKLQETNTAELTWKVASEYNVNRYELYRSYDNVSYTLQSETPASLSGNNVKIYSTQNTIDVEQSVVYYKLKMIDHNGSFTWSSKVSIELPLRKSVIRIVPNPAKGMVTISNFSKFSSSLLVVSSTGAVVYSQSLLSNKKQSSVKIDISAFAPGVYTVMIDGSAGRLIVE